MSKKLKLSPWHSAKTKPVHPGIYETNDGGWYRYFDGEKWHFGDDYISANLYESGLAVFQNWRWRGVLK